MTKEHEYKRYTFVEPVACDESQLCAEDGEVMALVLDTLHGILSACRSFARLMHRNDDTLLYALRQVELVIGDEVAPIKGCMDTQLRENGYPQDVTPIVGGGK